jgi:hypothetical protein
VQDPIPTHPTDPASASLRDLIAGYESHLTPLVNPRLGIGEPEPVGRIRADVLDSIVCGPALADRLTATRWATAAEALAYTAPVAHVAAAFGRQIDEVAARPRSRADGQRQPADTSAAAHAAVHPLPDNPEAGR